MRSRGGELNLFPFLSAIVSALWPTLLVSVTLAPLSMSSEAVLVWPPSAARCSGVFFILSRGSTCDPACSMICTFKNDNKIKGIERVKAGSQTLYFVLIYSTFCSARCHFYLLDPSRLCVKNKSSNAICLCWNECTNIQWPIL